MSYTMTMDMPTRASAYVERRGPRFKAQLQSLVIAFVMTEMQNDRQEWADAPSSAQTDSPSVRDLCGIVRLPDGFSDKDIRAQAALEKYERLS